MASSILKLTFTIDTQLTGQPYSAALRTVWSSPTILNSR